jgi:hypothetical protein
VFGRDLDFHRNILDLDYVRKYLDGELESLDCLAASSVMIKAFEYHLQVPSLIPLRANFGLGYSLVVPHPLSGYVLRATLRLGHCRVDGDGPLVMGG